MIPQKTIILDTAIFQSGKIDRIFGWAHPVIFLSEAEAKQFRKFV